nr:zinc knuckle CX2CX4HX4C [Tanacetum cinerariifolium]
MDQRKVPTEGVELLRNVALTMNRLTGKGDAGIFKSRMPSRVSQNPNSGLSCSTVCKTLNMHRVVIIRDIDAFVQDLQSGKHEPWTLLSKEKGHEITDIVCNRYTVLESACKLKGTTIVDDIPSVKVLPWDSNVDDKLSDMVSPSETIVQSVDIHTKSTSYAGVAGAKELTRIPIWVKLHDVPIQVFEEDGSSLIATFIEKPSKLSMNRGHPGVMYKKRKGKSKSTNGGQFVGPSVKQNVRYEPKAATIVPKKGATNVEEVVENVYAETTNIFLNTISGISSFMAATG